MNMGEAKGHHLDMPTAILQKIVLGNTMLLVGLPDMEEVHPPQPMEGDLPQGRHLRLEDMADNLPALHRHLEDMEDNLLDLHQHLEDMEDSLPGLRQHLGVIGLHLEVMELTLCRVEILHSRDRKPQQISHQYSPTEMSLLHHCRFTILVKAR